VGVKDDSILEGFGDFDEPKNEEAERQNGDFGILNEGIEA
jgi:hypothetical protein